MSSLSREAGTRNDHELLSAVSLWNYLNYVSLCSGCYDSRRFMEMAVDGGSVSIFDHQRRLRDMCVCACERRWRSSSSLCTGIFLNMPDLNMLFVHHATKVEYVHQMREILRTDI